MTSQTIKVAAGQFPASNNISHNIKNIEVLMQEAAEQGVELVVFPEAAMCAFGSPLEELSEIAAQHSAPFIEFMQNQASRCGIDVVVGLMSPPLSCTDDPRVQNQLLHINARGELCHRYNKLHLYDAFKFKESDKVRPGDLHPNHEELVIFDLKGFRFGLMNCYDLRFPELGRLLIDAGVNVISLSAAWLAGSQKEAHWEILARARAIENTAYVIASGQTPPKNCGMSMVIDPMGAVIAGAAEETGLAVATLKTERIENVRKTLPCIENRRYRQRH